MGNGHAGQNGSASVQDFLATNADANSVNTSNFETEKNLDLNSSDISWANSSPDRDLRNLGGSAMNPHESSSSLGEKLPSLDSRIVNLEMPPGMKQAAAPNQTEIINAIETSLNSNAIKTGDRLDSAGVKEIDNAIVKLNQTGDIADFYDTARDAMEINLDNSYNRKLAA